MEEERLQCTTNERRFYGIYFCGQNVLWAFAGLVSTFLLDVGIDPTTASAILLAPKIWDAVNDTLFGFLVDKFTFKNREKFMPWIKIGTATIGLFTIAMFAIPREIGNAAKLVWFVLAYILFDAAYTMLDAPMYAMPTVMTTNINERTSLVSANRFWGNFGAIVATVTIPMLRSKTGWFWGSVLFCAIGVAFMIPFLFCGKERAMKGEDAEQTEYTFKEMWAYLKSNKYLTLTLAILLIIGCCGVESCLSLIMARNCLGNESMGTVVTAVVAFPVVIVALLTPKLAKKYDKYNLLVFGLIVACAASIVLYFVGYSNLIPVLALMGVKFIGASFYNVLNYMFIADSVEYGTYKSGTRAAGITFSLQTFTSKLKGAIINSLALFCLGLFGYDSNLPEGAIQAKPVVDGIWKVFNLLPAIGYGIAIVLLVILYKLRDKDVETMARYNNGEITFEEADALLGDRFGKPANIE